MRLFILAASAFFLLANASCGVREKIVYFQPNESGSDTLQPYSYSPVYHMNDLLSVTVSAMDAEAVKPFNTSVVSYTAEDGKASTTSMQQGYFVDAAGMIEMPVIGSVHVGGLNRQEATQLIREKLSAYVVDPIVIVKVLNYKVTVLGDVKTPGTFSIVSERVTLPEALGTAGDLNITGVRKNILVIRDIDGVKTEIRVDLTSKECYNSPGYYLLQNDVVYVEPNKAKRNSSAVGTNAGLFVSVASLFLTTLTTIVLITK